MARSSKDSWLKGPGDLKEADVEDVPVKGESVRVRGLPAAFSNDATSKALEMTTVAGGEQVARVNTRILEVIQFQRGCVEPEFTYEEAEQVAQRFGPAFKKVVAEVDRLSGVDKQALEDAQSRFPAGSGSANGTEAPVEDGPSAGRSRPAVPSGDGA